MKTFFNYVMVFAATMLLASSCNKEPMNEPQPEPDNTVKLTASNFVGVHMRLGVGDMYMIMLSDNDNVHAYQFSLRNQLGEVDENGNVTIPAGTYTLSDGLDDYTIFSYTEYRDGSEDAENPKVVPFTDATAVVTENKIVLTAVIEDITHVVTYNGSLSVPADLPEPDVDFEANYAYVYYSENTSDENIAIFKLYLSDLGCDEDGNDLPNGTYYELNIITNRLDPNAEIAIPAGRYEIDDTSSATGYISRASYYKLGDSATELEDSRSIYSGYLTVNEDGSLEGSLELYSGATHNVTFSGDVELLENTMPSETPYSTLTSDRECDLSNHTLDIWYEGDSYGIGCHSWVFTITTLDSVGDNIDFRILRGTDRDANLSGTYTVSDSMEDYTVMPGYIDGFTLMCSWYYYRENPLTISDFAPIVDGTIEIQVVDTNVYNITINVYDDLNNNITGTFTQVIPAYASGASHPALTL